MSAYEIEAEFKALQQAQRPLPAFRFRGDFDEKIGVAAIHKTVAWWVEKPAAWREEVTEADALTKRKILEAKCERVYERLLAIKKRAEAMPPPPKRAASEPPLALGAPLKKRALEASSAA